MSNDIQNSNMKRWSVISGLLMLGGLFFITSLSSSESGEETRKLAAFSRVEVGGLVNVNLVKGDEFTAEVDVSGIALQDVITRVEGDTLIITTTGFHSGESISIDVVHQGVTAIKTAGSATITSEDTIEQDSFTVNIGGNGDADFDVDVDTLIVEMRGNGNLTIEGEAKQQQLRSFGGGGSFDNSDLEVEGENRS